MIQLQTGDLEVGRGLGLLVQHKAKLRRIAAALVQS